jgi:hypothetical protein
MRPTDSEALPGRPWTPPDDYPDGHAPASTPPLDDHGDALPSIRPDAQLVQARRPRKLELRATKPAHGIFDSSGLSASDDLRRSGAQTPTYEYTIGNMPARNSHPFIADPITPNQTPWSSGFLPSNAIPQYPYTPESVRTTKSHGIWSLSPLPSMPWDIRDSCSSPMQEALLTCASNLESLIMSREPTDEQMEYLVSKFEEMANFLSAPDSQSKQTDDHLFSDGEPPSDATGDATGLGIKSEEPANDHVNAGDLALSRGYILQVGKYIEDVKAHVQDLTMRMDEVKQLNSIQLDIISDLRKDIMKRTNQVIRDKDEPLQGPEQKPEPLEKMPPRKKAFWSAVGEALDAVGDAFHDW